MQGGGGQEQDLLCSMFYHILGSYYAESAWPDMDDVTITHICTPCKKCISDIFTPCKNAYLRRHNGKLRHRRQACRVVT